MIWSSLMRADQFEKKERQLRAALEVTTRRVGEHFANPAGAPERGGLPAEPAEQRGTQK